MGFIFMIEALVYNEPCLLCAFELSFPFPFFFFWQDVLTVLLK